MFGEVLPAPEAELRSELGWLADHLGAVRDVDVQLASLTKVAAEVRPDAEALAPVLHAFEATRSSARAELVEALDGPRYAALVGALSAVVAQAPGTWPGRAALPAEETLPELIRARYRRFRKAARDAHATSPADELHRARIRGKQLRYGLEFVADVYGKPARSLSRRVVKIQDVFGAIQDAAVMDQRLRSLGQPGHELPPSSMFVLGQLAQCYAQQSAAQRREIAKALGGVSPRALASPAKRSPSLSSDVETMKTSAPDVGLDDRGFRLAQPLAQLLDTAATQHHRPEADEALRGRAISHLARVEAAAAARAASWRPAPSRRLRRQLPMHEEPIRQQRRLFGRIHHGIRATRQLEWRRPLGIDDDQRPAHKRVLRLQVRAVHRHQQCPGGVRDGQLGLVLEPTHRLTNLREPLGQYVCQIIIRCPDLNRHGLTPLPTV